jgi:hypothetical protein
MQAAKLLELHEGIEEHRDDWMARRRQMKAEGQRPPYMLEPGEVPPTEVPPEVDW